MMRILKNRIIILVNASVLLCGLIGLSIMPHQEARFLCPLLVPLVMIYTWKQDRIPTSFWTIWILFNIITVYVFGVIHQGGIFPALGFLHRQTSGLSDCHVLNNGDLTCTAGPTRKFTSFFLLRK
jgi:phosphatidylinositol glycan class Z